MNEDGTKRPVTGTLVKVLVHRREDRGMVLEGYASRCVRQGEVHELVTTDHTQTSPGTRIDRVAFLGFAEISCAGVIDRGDQVWINDRRIGRVLGFDACHVPNHYNILISADVPQSGLDLGLEPEARIRFEPALPGAGTSWARPRGAALRPDAGVLRKRT